MSSFSSLAAPLQHSDHRYGVPCRASNKDYSQETRMREEVIYPFRTLRMFLYIGFMGSAGVGALIVGLRLLAAFAGAPGDGMGTTVQDNLIDLGIDLAAFALFALLYRNDSKAKEAQLVKLAREEALSQLRVELATGRMVKVAQLRGAARLVIVAGPLSHVQRALALAEPLKEQLLERGVTVVPFVTEEDVEYSSALSGTKGGAKGSEYRAFVSVVEAEAAKLTASEKGMVEGSLASEDPKGKPKDADSDRWLVRPLYTNEWSDWLKDQLKFANFDSKTPVYLSLRLDGRVRGSGVGFPRWQVIASQLPPMKGMWKGPFDGMDGRVF